MADYAATYYQAQTATATTVTNILDVLWREFLLSDIDGSWAAIRGRAILAIASGQLRSATAPGLYLAALLADSNVMPAAAVAVRPEGFVGFTSAGLPLAPVLDLTPIRIKTAISKGVDRDVAMRAGLALTRRLAFTEVQDSGRAAMDVGMRVEPKVIGYRRRSSGGGSCDRCAVLLGRVYRYSAGFQRHPGCDCTHEPVLQGKTESQPTFPAAAGMSIPGVPFKGSDGVARMTTLRIAAKARTEAQYASLLKAHGYAA
jgi:hypothetical protein